MGANELFCKGELLLHPTRGVGHLLALKKAQGGKKFF